MIGVALAALLAAAPALGQTRVGLGKIVDLRTKGKGRVVGRFDQGLPGFNGFKLPKGQSAQALVARSLSEGLKRAGFAVCSAADCPGTSRLEAELHEFWMESEVVGPGDPVDASGYASRPGQRYANGEEFLGWYAFATAFDLVTNEDRHVSKHNIHLQLTLRSAAGEPLWSAPLWSSAWGQHRSDRDGSALRAMEGALVNLSSAAANMAQDGGFLRAFRTEAPAGVSAKIEPWAFAGHSAGSWKAESFWAEGRFCLGVPELDTPVPAETVAAGYKVSLRGAAFAGGGVTRNVRLRSRPSRYRPSQAWTCLTVTLQSH